MMCMVSTCRLLPPLAQVEAKNSLENYLYTTCNSILRDESIATKLSAPDRETITK